MAYYTEVSRWKTYTGKYYTLILRFVLLLHSVHCEINCDIHIYTQSHHARSKQLSKPTVVAVLVRVDGDNPG